MISGDPALYLNGAFGVVSLCVALWETYIGFVSEGWSRTQGRIIDRKTSRVWRNLLETETEIFYEFEVDGYRYVSSNISPGVFAPAWGISIPKVWPSRYEGEAFEPGAEIEVIYDPRRPRRCALEPPNFTRVAFFFLLGAALTIFTVKMLHDSM